MNAMDAELFDTWLTHWVSSSSESLARPGSGLEVAAADGETSRRTHDRFHDRNPLHLVSASASSQRLVLDRQACTAKSNEITAIPLLLDRVAIRSALVTIVLRQCQDEG